MTGANGDGRFSLEDVPGGEVVVRVTARHGDPLAPSVPERRLPADGREIEIRIDRGGILRLRILDWPRGRWGSIWIRSGGRTRRISERPDDSGRLRLEGVRYPLTVYLRPGPYSEERCLLLTDLAAGDGERVVRLRPGLAVSGRLVLPAGTEASSVSVVARVLGGDVRFGRVEAGGRYEVRGLPEGTWPLTVRLGKKVVRTEVRAGTTRDIDLR